MKSAYEILSAALSCYFDARIHEPPILDVARFADSAVFIADWRRLAGEASSLGRRWFEIPTFENVMAEQAYLSRYGGKDWRIFVVKAYGHLVERNAERAPALCAALTNAPDVLSASYSFIPAGKVIPPHRGPFRGVFRFYLGLEVPVRADGEAAALLQINGVDYRLRSGQALLWDDTYPHMVANEGTDTRIALLLDIKRDRLPWDARLVSRAAIAMAGWLARKRLSG